MAKPANRAALKTRLNTLRTELDELQTGAAQLAASSESGSAAEGLSRAVKEMKKSLNRVTEQGYLTKL